MPKLSKTEYTKEELINEMMSKNLSLKEVLFYNKNLSADFCVKYLVFNDDCATGVEDTYIGFDDVLFNQPHLKMKDLIEADERIYQLDDEDGIIKCPLYHSENNEEESEESNKK